MIIKALSEPNKKSIWLALGWSALILFLSFKAPSLNPKYTFSNEDKVVHFTFYFVFVFLWYRFLYFKQKRGAKVVAALAFTAIMIGVVIEVLQGLLTNDRQTDIYDAIANTLGALTGIVFSLLILHKEKQ